MENKSFYYLISSVIHFQIFQLYCEGAECISILSESLTLNVEYDSIIDTVGIAIKRTVACH